MKLATHYFLTAVLLVCLTVLSACARITAKTENTPSGTDWTITYVTWFKDLKEVAVEKGPDNFVEVSVGSSTSVPPSNDMIACALSPHLCQ